MPRLTKTERETIIIKYLKGQKTPGYEVIECNNGKYQVREKKLQVEVEEDEDESIDEQTMDEYSNGREYFQSETIDEQSEESQSGYEVHRTEEKPKPKPKKTHKQNARKLLAQLQELMNNGEDETSEDYSEEQTDNGIYYNGASNEPRRVTWERRKLRLM